MELNPHFIALLAGFLLDKLLGDPAWLPHPIIVYGKAVAWFDRKLNRGNNKIIKGALAALILVIASGLFFLFLIYFTYKLNFYLGLGVEALFIFYGLAGMTLIKEGKAVFSKLEIGLDAGRKQVARIVGRDTSQLNREQVCAATLETMAENLSDGVIAPLFWYALGGVPAMMTYKMVNTLDSMIGYKSEKYLLFGRFAARLDDVLNFIPARLTAFFMALVNLNYRAFIFIFKYGRAHTSPNAGYPEAALAGILNVRFGGTHIYFGKEVKKPYIGEHQRPFTQKDINTTIKTNLLSELFMTGIIILLIYKGLCPVFNFINHH